MEYQPENRVCQNCKKDFIIESDDFSFYEKIKVPSPTFCPECRMIRKLSWRNDRYLFKEQCQLCGKVTFSTLKKDNGYKIFCPECWSGDNWDRSQYCKNYDFSKSFFEQFKELYIQVPKQSRNVIVSSTKNSDYTNHVGNLKNCYLIYNSDYDENCSYGTDIERSRDCIDNTMIDKCEQCYNNVNCQKCYKTFYSTDCVDSSNILFSYDLVGCMNCFGCTGLRSKNYFIFNKPYLKEEYFKKVQEFFNGKYSQVLENEENSRQIYLKIPRRYMHGRQNLDVSGDYIYNSKEIKKSFIVSESQNCKYCTWLIAPNSKDCWDYIEYGDNAEQIYETITSGLNSNKIKFCNIVLTSTDVEYSMHCINTKNCFGCVGMKKSEYCILNKQYTKEDYFETVEKIKKHMNDMPYTDTKGRIYKYGEFFPVELSPYPYNQTNAQEFFPIKKIQVVNLGYSWKDIEDKNYIPTLQSSELLDSIGDISDKILNETIECCKWGNEESKMWNCTKAFKITENELIFYKQNNIPIPRMCPNCRHHFRIQKRNPLKLWHRTCMKEGCTNEFETSYSPDRPEIIYCEKCYQQEVY